MSDKHTSDIHTKVKDQFGKTAQNYVTSAIHAKGDDLKVMLELAGDVAGQRVLDIATGGGHTALAFAQAGAKVTATDLTPKMLIAAKTYIEAQGLKNVSFQEANAESLPFDSETFEIVTCRIAPHHFANPEAFVREAARVLKADGSFLLIDNIAPLDPDLARVMNTIEKTRDPSHVEAYPLMTWFDWLNRAGLELHHLSRFYRHKDFDAWIGYAEAEKIRNDLETYVLGLDEYQKHYLNVIKKEGKLSSLSHEVVLLKAIKGRQS